MTLPFNPSKRLPVYENLAERERLLARTWERLDPKFRTPNQVLGRRATIGCVALEVTQRCNLDCTLCYLSESAESVKDLPIEVLFEGSTGSARPTGRASGSRSRAATRPCAVETSSSRSFGAWPSGACVPRCSPTASARPAIF